MLCGAAAHWQLSTALRMPTCRSRPKGLNEEAGEGPIPEEAPPPCGSPAHERAARKEPPRRQGSDLILGLGITFYLFLIFYEFFPF